MSGHERPSIGTSGGNDTGARLAHLQDLIERNTGHAANGLPAVFHECVGAGAMRSQGDDGTVLLTFITSEGQSHVFAVSRKVNDALRGDMATLRNLVRSDAAIVNAGTRAPITKPNGRVL